MALDVDIVVGVNLLERIALHHAVDFDLAARSEINGGASAAESSTGNGAREHHATRVELLPMLIIIIIIIFTRVETFGHGHLTH